MWLISLNKISWVFGTEMVMGLGWCSDSRDTKTLTSDHVHSAAETEPGMQQVQPFQLIRRTSSHPRAEVPLPPHPHRTCLATKNGSPVCGIILSQHHRAPWLPIDILYHPYPIGSVHVHQLTGLPLPRESLRDTD